MAKLPLIHFYTIYGEDKLFRRACAQLVKMSDHEMIVRGTSGKNRKITSNYTIKELTVGRLICGFVTRDAKLYPMPQPIRANFEDWMTTEIPNPRCAASTSERVKNMKLQYTSVRATFIQELKALMANAKLANDFALVAKFEKAIARLEHPDKDQEPIPSLRITEVKDSEEEQNEKSTQKEIRTYGR